MPDHQQIPMSDTNTIPVNGQHNLVDAFLLVQLCNSLSE
jgi:hypothetical protein